MNPSLFLISTEKYYNNYFDFKILRYPHSEVLKQLNNPKLPALFILWQEIGKKE